METSLSTLLIVLACLGLSFFLSGMEAGVFALSRVRIRQQMRAGKYSARLLHGYLEDPERFLWTILVGNTLANFIALGLIVAELHEWLMRLQVTELAAIDMRSRDENDRRNSK